MKTTYRITSLTLAFAMAFTVFSNALASRASTQAPIYERLTATNSAGWDFETSGAMESVTASANGWMMKAGGDVASTHYARAKYKAPESSGAVFTYFYTRAVIVLPADFYTQHKAGFRLLNTDNYQTTLNGATVGALNADELRVSVYMNSDHRIRVLVDHENGIKLELYAAPNILPTGEHTFEFSGDVANSAPWFFKIDGAVAASGVQRLSTDDMANSERVITRFVAGIDGAADQDQNAMSVTVKSLEVANYDLTNIPPVTKINIRVANGKNDVEESANGNVSVGSTDLELVYDGNLQTVGIRFLRVNIPNGAVIAKANLIFKVDEASVGALRLKIQGEANINAPVFTIANRNVSSRMRTAKAVFWSPLAWSIVGANQSTPNIAPIIQEIVNQSGWTAGNALVIIITGNASKRVAEAFEGDAAGAPLLHIEYK